MKIRRGAQAGFCFGVKRAIAIAIEAAKSGKKVYMLGDIVHNEAVVRQIAEAGIKKIGRLEPVRGKVLIIRAHGTSDRTIRRARACGYLVIDATCPMVKEIHAIARDKEKKGYPIIVIGDKKHEEVQGIIGNLRRRSIVIEDGARLPLAALSRLKKACVVVQSTQNLEKVEKIVRSLREKVPGLVFCNTICKPTRAKQDEMRKMPRENDVMIIIGSKKSANTKRLYEISKSQNPKTYWINAEAELNMAWFRKAHSVGITAGASTPDATIRKIIRAIQAGKSARILN